LNPPSVIIPDLTCSRRWWPPSTGDDKLSLCMWHLPWMLLGNLLSGM
jgi:hypothetical protein